MANWRVLWSPAAGTVAGQGLRGGVCLSTLAQARRQARPRRPTDAAMQAPHPGDTIMPTPRFASIGRLQRGGLGVLQRFRATLAVLALATTWPLAAQAQSSPPAGPPLPQWQAAGVCARDSVPGQCTRAETSAANTVSASWQFIANDVRARCLESAAAPAAQSWRLLAACLEVGASRGEDPQAVLTARTPTEPVPPKKIMPIVAPAGVAEPAAAGAPAAAPPPVEAAAPPPASVDKK